MFPIEIAFHPTSPVYDAGQLQVSCPSRTEHSSTLLLPVFIAGAEVLGVYFC